MLAVQIELPETGEEEVKGWRQRRKAGASDRELQLRSWARI
jgi:hypothetical protein